MLRPRCASCFAHSQRVSRARRNRVIASRIVSKRARAACSMQLRAPAPLLRRAVFHQIDQRQGRLAFAQVVADVLADRFGVAGVVEHSRRSAGTRCRASGRIRPRPPRSARRSAGNQRAELGRGFEQLGRLGADHLQVALLRRRPGRACSAAAALRLRRSRWWRPTGFASRACCRRRPSSGTSANTGNRRPARRGVAEQRVGGLAAAPQVGFVDHVVVQQRGGMDEFDDGGQFMMRGARRIAVARSRSAAPAPAASACRRR